jgi:hypothetical protein
VYFSFNYNEPLEKVLNDQPISKEDIISIGPSDMRATDVWLDLFFWCNHATVRFEIFLLQQCPSQIVDLDFVMKQCHSQILGVFFAATKP